MDLNALKVLDSGDLAALIALAQDYRDGLRRGTITGTGQGVAEELADVDALIAKLQAAL
ncbi:MAG TPA: hypothetical protein VN803_11180 [Gemmatimonadales bacterium]|nr:hypothetical protein [Gemmatimonadales bacterium]